MKIIKSVFGFFWAIWGAIWFMIIITIFTIAYAIILTIGGRKYAMACVWFNFHYVSRILLVLYLIRVKVYGKEKIDPKKTYVIVANHTAQMDIVAGTNATPQPAKFLAKSEIKYVPFFGYMTKMLAIMVDRKNKESREKSFRLMIDALRNGESIFIYPEGTRNRTDQPLKEFKNGAFRVAIMAQAPIAVQTIIGAKALNDPNGVHLLPGTLKIYWSDPIETTGMTLSDLPGLKAKVKSEMLKHILAANAS